MTELHVPRLCHVSLLDDVDLRLAVGRADDGALRDKDCLLSDGLFDAHPDVKTGQQVALRIGEFTAEGDLARRRIDAGAAEEQLPGFAIDGAVVEDELDVGLAWFGRCEAAVLDRPLQRQQVSGGLHKVGINGVDLLDHRQRVASIGRHQRAFRHQRAADDA